MSGNPVNYVDPTGEFACGGVCIGIIGGAIEYGAELYQNDVRNECVDLGNVAIGAVLGGVPIPAIKAAKYLLKWLKGTNKAVAGKITGYTKHGLNQAIGRNGGKGVKAEHMLDAIRNPIKIVEQANGAMKYQGKKATVILNGKGKVVTTYGKSRGPQIWQQ